MQAPHDENSNSAEKGTTPRIALEDVESSPNVASPVPAAPDTPKADEAHDSAPSPILASGYTHEQEEMWRDMHEMGVANYAITGNISGIVPLPPGVEPRKPRAVPPPAPPPLPAMVAAPQSPSGEVLALMSLAGVDAPTAARMLADKARRVGAPLVGIAGIDAAPVAMPAPLAEEKAKLPPPIFQDKFPLRTPNGCRISHDLDTMTGVVHPVLEYPRGTAREVIAWFRKVASDWEESIAYYEKQAKLREEGQIP